ncbi:MAG TPA: hypothetical protein VGQ24_10640 [Gemmatimonadales bacterium]|jgi:hypothetical protein|nr:hypothetical protein [Gemmatimonadales bacterium]
MYTIDPLNGDLVMDRGDFVNPELRITDADGVALNVTGATFKLTVKAALEDSLAAAMFQLVSPGDFDLSGAATGIVVPLILETFTQGLAGDYSYDVEMVLGGKTTTLVRAALFRVLKEVSDVGVAPSPPSVLVPFPGDIQIIGGKVYITDTGIGANAGKNWKLVVQDGVFDVQGPSDVVPF